jgi:Na+/H+-dicarboxylate symporter
MNSHNLQTSLMIAGLILGAIFGQALHEPEAALSPFWGETFDFVGSTVFMGLLKMVLVPLVATSVIVGVGSLSDASQLGKIGGLTIGYYFGTMVLAVLLGVVLVTTIAPGEGMDAAFRETQAAEFAASDSTAQQRVESNKGLGMWGAFKNIATQVIPSNPINAAANGQLLPVISFSILFGIALMVVGEAAQPVFRFCRGVLEAIMMLVEWILWLAPLGVFCLIAKAVAEIGLTKLAGPVGSYMVVVLVGLGIHAIVTIPICLRVFGRTNPFLYLWALRSAVLTAFGTASSSATLPVTIEAATTEGGASKKASEFVLPLGATVNMDGTALYESVAVVFLFQCYGIELGAVEIAIIVLTATLAAVGAAGIPSAGLVTMVIVVEAVNHSLDGTIALPLAAIGIILGVDRILDMCRTAVNVWGDAAGARIITRWAPDPVE